MATQTSLLMDIPIDRHSEEPIYQQLIRHFQGQIASGRLPAGTRLPPSRDLAHELGIGRISVVSAYTELQTLGLISAHPGRGTFVTGIENGRKSATVAASMPARRQLLPQQNIGEMQRLAQRPGVISFSGGAPPEDFLPLETFRRALDAVLERDGVKAITYEDPDGYLPLRISTRDYVTSLGINCKAENIIITGGAQQALDLVVQAMLNPGDTIVTTSPTYIGILDIAQVRRANVIGIPMDEHGIRLDALEDVLIDYHPRLLYITPTFSNPTGIVMPLHRRRQLLRLAQQYELTILEDSVYHELHFDEPAPPPLKALDETGCVIHASGYSKILLPGMRIGYLITEGSTRERIARVKYAADVCTPTLNQRAVQLFIKRGGLPGHLDRVRHVLKDRRDVAIAAAQQHFPEDFHWNVPTGGLYLWVELPEHGPSAAELYVSAIQHGVAYAIGSLFYPNGEGARFIRLNFGAHPAEKIHEGFRRLADAWYEFQSSSVERKPIL